MMKSNMNSSLPKKQRGGFSMGLRESEMKTRIQERDWSATPLGPMTSWPQHLLMAVDLMLNSREPVYIGWGPEVLSLYNDACIPILGGKHPGALGRPYAEVWPEIWEDFRPMVEATMAGEAHQFTDRPIALQSRAGRPVGWFTFYWTPLRDDTGGIGGMYCTATETTDRVLSVQNAFRQQEERYQSLSNSIDQGLCVLEVLFDGDQPVDYRFLEVNGAFERETGLVDVVGKTWSEVGPNTCSWLGMYADVALTGEPRRTEIASPALGREFEVCAFRTGAPEERTVGVLVKNVTERKQAERALKESEERFQQFAETTPDVIVIRDAGTMECIYLSPAFERITGLKREQAMGSAGLETWLDMVLPEDRERLLQARAAAVAGEQRTIEFRIKRLPDGEICWVRNTLFPMHDHAGKVRRIGGIMHDFTDLKKAQRNEQQLLAQVQHKVRNTVSVIRSIARRSAETSGSAEDLAQHFEGRLDAFARVQSATIRKTDAALDLELMLRDELNVAARQRTLSIFGPTVLLRDKAAEVVGLALHELTTNSLKYGALAHEGGHLDIHWRAREVDGKPVLDFTWAESGLSGIEPPEETGFSTELIERMMPYDLNAVTSLDYQPTGLVCRIKLPLSLMVSLENDVEVSP